MTVLKIETGDKPKDEAPDDLVGDPFTGDYDPAYPGSTPEAPYGFKANGQPYTRRPRGSGGSATVKATGTKRMPASDSQARAAANMLGHLNTMLGLGLTLAGMPTTAESLATANEQFTAMAYDSLLTDPALCKKILGAGATSGKAGLTMAYVMLGASIFPAARMEIAAARLAKGDDNE